MGIYSRDYIRNDRPAWRDQWSSSGCKWVIIVTIVVFVLQLVTQRPAEIIREGDDESMRLVVQRPAGSLVTNALELDPHRTLHGQVWRLVTYAFCHQVGGGFPWHILINMLFVGFWGTTLERMYGTREFVLFYLAGAFVSGLAFVAMSFWQGDPTPAIGASGAVMAVVALYAIHYPRQEVYFWFFPIPVWILVIGFLIMDLLPVIQSLGGAPNQDHVAHAAHLGGLAFGYIYYRYGLRLDRLWSTAIAYASKRPRLRPRHVKIYNPREEEPHGLDSKVDSILQKIHAQGEASLSDQEREVLRRASERYKSNQRNP